MIIDASDRRLQRNNGFVVLEGVNGAGKSTIKKHIEDLLIRRNIKCLLTFEPGDSTLGKILRPIILGNDLASRTALAELFLIASDRAAHVEEVIRPALKEKVLVVSDRYYYSTVAFQGFGRGLDLSLIEQVNSMATAGLLPDLMILLDLEADAGLKRSQCRSKDVATAELDLFEKEDLSFHRRIRQGFLAVARDCAEPCIVIDAGQSLESVLAQVTKVMEIYLGVVPVN